MSPPRPKLTPMLATKIALLNSHGALLQSSRALSTVQFLGSKKQTAVSTLVDLLKIVKDGDRSSSQEGSE
jgi:hypothetical protein